MGNRFTNQKAGDDWLEKSLKLSNGATDVMIAALVLSASDIAETDWQKLFTCWIAGHDQSLHGSGTVGFDIDDIGWTTDNFATEKAFVLQAVDMAIQKQRWSELEYTPADFIPAKLHVFRDLVSTYSQDFVDTDNDWSVSIIQGDMAFQLCPIHHVYMHLEGCVICTHSSNNS